MNRKQFAILLVLLIVLGGAGWWVEQSRNQAASAGEQGTGGKLMGESFPVNDVAAISISQDTNLLTLEQKNGVWSVRERNDYPANFSQISGFLIKLADLKIVQSEDVGPSQLSRMQLAPQGQGTNSGTTLDFKNKDAKDIASLTLGRKHLSKSPQAQQQSLMGEGGFPDGRYVMLPGKSGTVILIGDPLNSIEPKAEDWLDKDFFKVERPKAVSVIFPVATNSWKIVRDSDSGDWKLADAKDDEKLDAARVTDVSSPFSSPSFNDVAVGSNGADMSKPTVISVDTFDDFNYTVKVGAKSGDNYPITISVTANFPKERISAGDEKPEDKTLADKAWKERQAKLEDNLKSAKKFENWTYLVSSWSIDPLLKERKDLLAEKKVEPKPDEKPAAKTETSSGSAAGSKVETTAK